MNQNVLELIAHYCNNDQIACLFRDKVITEEMAVRASKFECPKGECKGCWFCLFAAHFHSFDLEKNRYYTLDRNTHLNGAWQVCTSIMFIDQEEKIGFFRDPETCFSPSPDNHLDFLPEHLRKLFTDFKIPN